MIAYAMLYTVAASVPILLAAVALSAVLRRYGRPERAVWLGALVLALAVPALVLLAPAPEESAAVTAAAPVGVIGLPEFVVVPVQESTLDWAELALIAWLLVSAGMIVRWSVAAYELSRASRRWFPGTIDGVSVWMTHDVGPAVSGVFRPRVLAPSWLHTLPSRQRMLVLLHEQEHIRARDPLLIAGTRVARILAPWNPVVWILSARLVRAVELDCDRRVLRRTADVATYGYTLLTVSERRPGRLVAAAAFAESEAPLRGRILAMTTPPRAVSIAAIASATILGVVLLVGALQIPVPAVRIDVAIGPEPDQTPSVAVFDAPPMPPPAPPAPDVVVGAPPSPSDVVVGVPTDGFTARVDRNGEVVEVRRTSDGATLDEIELQRINESRRAGAPAPTRESAAPVVPPTTEPQPDEDAQPRFTPMSVRPVLTNVDEVQSALMREYPPALRDAGIGGAPVLWLYIGTDGSVQRTQIVESSGFAALDEAAQRVAEAMSFRPAQNRDQTVAVWVQIPIRFQVLN